LVAQKTREENAPAGADLDAIAQKLIHLWLHQRILKTRLEFANKIAVFEKNRPNCQTDQQNPLSDPQDASRVIVSASSAFSIPDESSVSLLPITASVHL
jgi:hypothetical protein